MLAAIIPWLARAGSFIVNGLKSVFNPANVIKAIDATSKVASKVGQAAAVGQAAIEAAKSLPHVGEKVTELVNNNPSVQKAINQVKNATDQIVKTAGDVRPQFVV